MVYIVNKVDRLDKGLGLGLGCIINYNFSR